MKNAARVMQLNIQIPQTIFFLMVHDTHHGKHIIYKIYIYIIYIFSKNVMYNNLKTIIQEKRVRKGCFCCVFTLCLYK